MLDVAALGSVLTPSREVVIKLPKLYPLQSEIARSTAKRKVIVIGRRAGKTKMLAERAIRKMLKGRRVLYAAPTADQTGAFWDNVNRWTADAVKAKVIKRNETERSLSLVGSSGRIRAKTAWNADTLRGDYADDLMLDEFALMDPDAWAEVGAPMLLDNDGDAWFSFTPKGHNHAHVLYQSALADTTGRWQTWQAPSTSNPHLSVTALAEITRDMTDLAYRQEILAEFVDMGGVVFRNVDPARTSMPVTEAQPGRRYVMGIDLGSTNDFTVISVLDATDERPRQVHLDRFTGIGWRPQLDRIAVAIERFRPDIVQVDRTGIGDMPFQELSLALPNASLWGVVFNAGNKMSMVQGLALAFERDGLELLDEPAQAGELKAYEATQRPSGVWTYNAPSGMHDDYVVALMLAYDAVTLKPWGVMDV